MAPLRSYALIVIATAANAHYVWQTTSGAETTVAFSEDGLPGNKNILGAFETKPAATSYPPRDPPRATVVT